MTLYEATEMFRDNALERFHRKSTAYYYCNHSKKSAKLRKEMTKEYNDVLFWEGILERMNGGLR